MRTIEIAAVETTDCVLGITAVAVLLRRGLRSLVGASGQLDAYHKGEAKLQVDGTNLAILAERILKVALASARGEAANV